MPPKETPTPSSSQKQPKSKGSNTKTLAKSIAIAIVRKTPSKSATKRPYRDIDTLSDNELS
jgi:hypothetical protein